MTFMLQSNRVWKITNDCKVDERSSLVVNPNRNCIAGCDELHTRFFNTVTRVTEGAQSVLTTPIAFKNFLFFGFCAFIVVFFCVFLLPNLF